MFRDVMRLMVGQMFESVGFDHAVMTMRLEVMIALIGSPPFTLF